MIRLNGHTVKFGKFPNGERYLPLHTMDYLKAKDKNVVFWIYQSDNEIFQLALLSDTIYPNAVGILGVPAELHIHYLPYSRMDRQNETYAFSLKTIIKMLNHMAWNKIIVREPHSEVTGQLLYDFEQENWCSDHVEKVESLTDIDSIFYPDAGAQARYNVGTNDLPWAVGNKTRDFDTGKITGMEITGNVGKRVLIMDDMCSRGGTFVLAAKLLKEQGAEQVSLLVSYVENTIWNGELFDHIHLLFTSKDNPSMTKRKRTVNSAQIILL